MKSLIYFHFLLCITFINLSAQAQEIDLYDSKSSRIFAEYLMKSRQYDLASVELERLLFMNPDSDSIRYDLIKSYSLALNHEKALERLDAFREERMGGRNYRISDPTLSSYYAYNLLALNKYQESFRFIDAPQNALSESDRLRYKAFGYLLDNKYELVHAELCVNTNPFDDKELICEIAINGMNRKKRSPFVAASLSAIIPGLGKAYSSEWKDGIISLVVVGISAFQAYRGFSVNGRESVYGWIYGSLATGFYLGNIYGSIQSAKRFNKRQLIGIRQQTERAFYLRP
jgi:tetratricopeptide (TPR) repeat protein